MRWSAILAMGRGRGHPLSKNFLRVLLWSAVLAVLWIAGGVVEGNARVGFWAVAVAIDYIVIWFGFPFPGLGYTRTPEWSIAGEHLAERYELFIILALGESILITGATYGEIPRSAGIVMSAGADEMTIAHPLDGPEPAMTVMILGGPALYLIGNALFTWTLSGRVAWSRLIVVDVLASLAPMSGAVPALGLQTAATLSLISLVVWDVRRAMSQQGRMEPTHVDIGERGGRMQ